MVVPGTLFEELGFNYIGPVDGHDVQGLAATLKNMRDLKGPQLLHIMTKKGRGYAPAEKDPISFHAVPKFDPASGTCQKVLAACQPIPRSLVNGCVKRRPKTAN